VEFLLIAGGAENEVSTLWSFHFIAAAIAALFIRKLMTILHIGSVLDDTTLTRTANVFIDTAGMGLFKEQRMKKPISNQV